MKILLIHQPFPMGNYKLIPYIGEYLKTRGHDTYFLQQLNGAAPGPNYLSQIIDLNPDIVYFEMLDDFTFRIIEQLKNCKKILCYASKGIFPEFDDILRYKGVFYDSVITNSLVMANKFSEAGIENKFFEYYPAPITENEIEDKSKYKHDCVYLGGGNNRFNNPAYQLEQDIIYTNPLISVYGINWNPNFMSNYKGVLPYEDIASLYNNSKCAIGTIEPSQRKMGMINNRYCEMLKTGNKILSIDYPEVNFYGAEEFITFVSTQEDVKNAIGEVDPKVLKRQKEFILNKEQEFFNKLESLI